MSRILRLALVTVVLGASTIATVIPTTASAVTPGNGGVIIVQNLTPSGGGVIIVQN